MAGQLTNNDQLIREIMRLSEKAAQFHGSMAGSVVFPESFIRDWVAIELHRQNQQPKLGVTLETGRADVLRHLVDAEKWEAHDLLKLGSYRLDMIVWEEPARPRAIVEFKRSPLVRDDLARTSAILSVAHREGLDGYIIACIADKDREKLAKYKSALDSIPEDERDGNVLARDPSEAPDGPDTAWCSVFAIKAKRPLL